MGFTEEKIMRNNLADREYGNQIFHENCNNYITDIGILRGAQRMVIFWLIENLAKKPNDRNWSQLRKC